MKNSGMNNNGVSGGIYGLAFIGALVYYSQHAATLWAGCSVSSKLFFGLHC